MDFGCYLAMTAGEFSVWGQMVRRAAWMACHYASYDPGLSNLPGVLPEGAMVIVNDRIPPAGHDAGLIAEQLQALCEKHRVGAVLMDLQREGYAESEALVRAVVRALPCPVGVSSLYAKEGDHPVFLSCPPPHVALEPHLAPWKGREVWLELAVEAEQAVVTEAGTQFSAVDPDVDPEFSDAGLHCCYSIQVLGNRAVFTLRRGREKLRELAREARATGVTRVIGLYQQLGADFSDGL